ncbi:hypothetical protein C0J52_18060 [Blattella germanica]|nr:hypothetical protein C0J52_18060 [Blattella germanica]
MESNELTNNCVNSTCQGRKVLGEINNSTCGETGNPLSPTANLKLLTKVASNFEKNKIIPISEDEKLASNVSKCRKTLQYVQSDENSKSRKEKSLSLLCNRFLQLFPMGLPPGDHMMISLDQAATKLGTERRRIYDIINVLESLQMAAKVGKNRYAWYGSQQLHVTLAQLKGLAERLGLREQESNVSAQTDGSVLPDNATERSLGIMCQKFIMLFLVCKEGELVNLDLAATILIGEGAEKDADSEQESRTGRFKTKVRRLYDIANVLTSLGLICKVPSVDNSLRKPAFKYIGPQVEAVTFTDEDVQLFNATRHSLLGTSPCLRPPITPSESRKRKQTGSIEQSPRPYCSRPVKRNPKPEDGRPLDEILHVAEMELKRLESQESSKSARKKLFEPCMSTTRKLVKVSDLMNQTANARIAPPSIQNINSLPATRAPESSNTAIQVQPPTAPTVVKLPVLTRPAIVVTPTQNSPVLYRVLKVGNMIQLLPLCNKPVKQS